MTISVEDIYVYYNGDWYSLRDNFVYLEGDWLTYSNGDGYYYNGDWYVFKNNNIWLTVTPNTGSNNGQTLVSASSFFGRLSRTATLVYLSNEIGKALSVFQQSYATSNNPSQSAYTVSSSGGNINVDFLQTNISGFNSITSILNSSVVSLTYSLYYKVSGATNWISFTGLSIPDDLGSTELIDVRATLTIPSNSGNARTYSVSFSMGGYSQIESVSINQGGLSVHFDVICTLSFNGSNWVANFAYDYEYDTEVEISGYINFESNGDINPIDCNGTIGSGEMAIQLSYADDNAVATGGSLSGIATTSGYICDNVTIYT